MILNNYHLKNLISEKPYLNLKVTWKHFYNVFLERRKRKERKQKEKEQKKIKALNGEDSASSALVPTGEATATKTAGEDEVESESSSSSSSEDTKDDKDKSPNNKISSKTKGAPPRSNNDEGEVSSVTTRQNKTERNHYILRMAIDEKYIPTSIQNLRFAAYSIFLILTLLSSKFHLLKFFHSCVLCDSDQFVW